MNLITGMFSTFRICAALVFSTTASDMTQLTQLPPLAPVTAPQSSGLPASDGIVRDSRMPDPTRGLIRIDVAVTDPVGKPVTGLTERDFTLLDNNEQQKIVTFQAFNGGIQPASSLEVVLTIDELNMLADTRGGKTTLTTADREVVNFLRSRGGILEHPVIIYRLTDHGLFVRPHASMDGNELADEIEQGGQERRIWSRPEVAGDLGKNAMGDDVLHSLVALGSIAIEERRKPGRKLMFWIGNGWQIEGRRGTGLSDFSIELFTRLREARINLWGSSEWPLYDAHRNPRPVDDNVDEDYLKRTESDSTDLGFLSLPVIAARSGGGMLHTRDNLAALIGERVKEGNRYYPITFDPPRTHVVDEYHHLEMVIGHANTAAHLFTDYYDEPVLCVGSADCERARRFQVRIGAPA